MTPGELLDGTGSTRSRERPTSTASSDRRSRIPFRRRCTTPRSVRAGLDAVYLPFPAADADDFVTFGARARRARRQRHDSVQSRAARSDGRGRRRRAPHRRHQHDSRDRRTLDRRQHRRGRHFFGRCAIACRSPDARVAVLGAGGSARAVLAALAEQRRTVTVYARNQARAEEIATTASRAAGPLPPAAGQLGSARQLHAGRHVSRTSTRRRSTTRRCPATGPSRVRPRLQPDEHAAAARGAGRRMRRRSAASRCSSRRRSSSSNGGPARNRRPASCGRPPRSGSRSSCVNENHVV